MNQKEPFVCYLCNTKENLIEVSEDYGICPPCRAQSLQEQLYYKSIRTNLFPEIDQIDERLYLGNEDAAISKDIVDGKGITAICVCGDNLLAKFKEDPSFQYKIYEISDYPKQQIHSLFEDHYGWMTKMMQQKRTILLHCAAGISRSASFTIAFLMRWKKMHLKDAYAHVKSRRNYIHPNSGFVQQLQLYQQQLIKKGLLPQKPEEIQLAHQSDNNE